MESPILISLRLVPFLFLIRIDASIEDLRKLVKVRDAWERGNAVRVK